MKPTTDRRAFVRRLFVQHRRRLQIYLRARLTNERDAEELAQETYLRLLRVKKPEFISNPEAYLFRIAHNLAHELNAAAHRVELRPFDDGVEAEMSLAQEGSLEDDVDRSRRLERIGELLKGVSPRCRAAMLLYWREGWTQQEIADEMGLSRSMVQKYMALGMAYCQEQLDMRDE